MAAEPYRRALGYTLLAYMTLMVAVVTLMPFSFAVPKTVHITLRGNALDIFNNIVLFVPLGFFFQITHDHRGLKSLFGALGLGLAVSGIVEAGQLFLPSRYSSLVDVVTNGLGAWLGAAIAGYHQLMVRRKGMLELFGFGLPLMSSVYLLVPLLWLGGLSMGGERSRIGLMALVGIYGAGVISAVIVNRLSRSRKRVRLAVFGYAAGWFMVGAVFALTHFPLAALVAGLMVGAFALASCCIWEKRDSTERRFELPTLKRLLPVYLVYLLLLSVWPSTSPLGQWHLNADFMSLDQAQRILFISRFVEVIAAFTLLGYLFAEMSGRRNETDLTSLKRVSLRLLAVTIFISILRNRLSQPLYIFMEAVVFTAAAIYGTIIYRLQLAVVKGSGKTGKKQRQEGRAASAPRD